MSPDRVDPFESSWDVVLARSSRGEDELRRPIIPLSRAQLHILASIDGAYSLHELVRLHPELKSHRLSRDCARLLAFGVVKTVRGELPRDLVVQAMNLTVRVPAAAFRAAVPDSQEHMPAAAPPPAASRGLLLLLAITSAAALAWWFSQR